MTEVLDSAATEPPLPDPPATPEARFEAFYRSTYNGAVRAARRVAGDRTDWVADAVQDAYERYWVRMPKRGDDHIKNRNYLYTIAINGVLRRHRDAKRQVTSDDETFNNLAGRPDPDITVTDQIYEILRLLPIGLRTVAVLAFELELTNPEIAEELGKTESTVRSQRERLRVIFKKELRPDGLEGDAR